MDKVTNNHRVDYLLIRQHDYKLITRVGNKFHFLYLKLLCYQREAFSYVFKGRKMTLYYRIYCLQ